MYFSADFIGLFDYLLCSSACVNKWFYIAIVSLKIGAFPPLHNSRLSFLIGNRSRFKLGGVEWYIDDVAENMLSSG